MDESKDEAISITGFEIVSQMRNDNGWTLNERTKGILVEALSKFYDKAQDVQRKKDLDEIDKFSNTPYAELDEYRWKDLIEELRKKLEDKSD